MQETNLKWLLHQRLYHERATVPVSSDLSVSAPVYQRGAEPLAGLVQPVKGQLHRGVGGAWPESTHVAYLQPGSGILPGDRVAEVVQETTLLLEVEAGAEHVWLESSSGIVSGLQVEVGDEVSGERRAVQYVEKQAVQVRPALLREHAAGERVIVLRRFEVVAREDEGGQGHHERLGLREVVG
jgi:hypothetical protein